MKIKEIRDKSKEELIQLLKESEEQLFNLRSSKSTGQLDKPHKFRDLKNSIARIKTVLNERSE